MAGVPVVDISAINYSAPEAPALPGQLRAGAHTDYGTVTILADGQVPPVGHAGLRERRQAFHETFAQVANWSGSPDSASASAAYR